MEPPFEEAFSPATTLLREIASHSDSIRSRLHQRHVERRNMLAKDMGSLFESYRELRDQPMLKADSGVAHDGADPRLRAIKSIKDQCDRKAGYYQAEDILCGILESGDFDLLARQIRVLGDSRNTEQMEQRISLRHVARHMDAEDHIFFTLAYLLFHDRWVSAADKREQDLAQKVYETCLRLLWRYSEAAGERLKASMTS